MDPWTRAAIDHLCRQSAAQTEALRSIRRWLVAVIVLSTLGGMLLGLLLIGAVLAP